MPKIPLLGLVLPLAACSGADKDDAGAASDVPDNAYCADVADWDPSWVALEEDVLDLVNAERAQGGTCGGDSYAPSDPLEMQPALRCAARVHALDMIDRGFFDHINPDGDGPYERSAYAGYDAMWSGENIAAGSVTAEGVMDQWMNSPGHCSNILFEDFTEIGVGYVPGGPYGTMWVQVFGTPF